MGKFLQRVRVRITPNNIMLTGPGPSMTVNNVTIDPQGTLLQIGRRTKLSDITAQRHFLV